MPELRPYLEFFRYDADIIMGTTLWKMQILRGKDLCQISAGRGAGWHICSFELAVLWDQYLHDPCLCLMLGSDLCGLYRS